MKKILLLGNTGQLGWEAQRVLGCLGELVALDYPDVDFTRPESLRALVSEIKPSVIYNAAAYTAVDRAESDWERCRMINVEAPAVLAEEARKHRAVFVHVSTDYVFDGKKGSAYTEEDAANPLSAYGRSKLESEQAVAAAGGCWFTFRTSWVFSNRRDSFVSKVLEWASKNPTLRIVDDQISGPTWARSLAEATGMVLAQGGKEPYEGLLEHSGLYHLAGWGWGSRKEWAEEILRLDPHPELRQAKEILGAKTAEFPAPAERPLFSALECGKFERVFGLRLPDWKEGVRLAMGG